jgi:putative transposase
VEYVCRNHATEILACDFFVTATVTFRLVFVFLVMEIGTRRILHWTLTEHPTAEWTTQQFRSVVTGDEPYRLVLHDRDAVFASDVDDALRSMNLRVLKTPARVPQANAFCERLIGTARRDVSTTSLRSMSDICGRSWPTGSATTIAAVPTRHSVLGFRIRQG